MSVPFRYCFLVGIFFLGSCVDPREGVATQEELVAEQFSEEILRIENLKDESIGWNEAVKLMTSRNIDIISSREQIKTSEEALLQVYRDLIPGAGISAGINAAVTDLANLSGDDFALSIFSFINIPGVIAYRIRYYAATLELLRARWAYELKLREQTIALHEQFLQYQLLQERTKNLVLSSRFQDPPSLLGGLDSTPESLQKEELAFTLESQNRNIQASISRLLGSTRSRWILKADTVPEWDYIKNPLTIKNPKKFGTLYRQLQALQLEGQRLSKLGVKLRYWPDINISLTSPPIYSVRGGRADGFDIDAVFVSLNTNVQLDTRLSIWTQLKQVERRIELDKRRLKQDNAILIEQLMTNQKALELNRKQSRLNDIRQKFLRKEERSLDPNKNRDQLEKSLALSERRTSLLIERSQLQASLWLLDERRWDRIEWEVPEKKIKK
ncbi:MAG: hypothetical protein AB8D78_03910 [Akkermansiaceae bacterium]